MSMPIPLGDGKAPGGGAGHESWYTVEQWAIREVLRLLKSRRMQDACAARAASRRAPALKKAAETLAAIAAGRLQDEKPLLPNILSAFVAKVADPREAQHHATERCRAWITANRWEIAKCNSALAMVACVAPIVDTSIQDMEANVDPVIDDICIEAIKSHKLMVTAKLCKSYRCATVVRFKRAPPTSPPLADAACNTLLDRSSAQFQL
mmetsp:Transcript_27874/g.71184  ORF Transcript_27874/g.71184 Transcript_27874/m.71184 type:complete len:208 (-) Transcript_27874:1143-1766(-)